MQELAKRIKDGDPEALKELEKLEGKHAATLLEQLRDDPEAYKQACIIVLKRYGNQ